MSLPEPHFIDRDPSVITAEMIAFYEAATGRPLQPAQVERLIIDVIAYRETLVRIAVQEACLQNLLAFAGFPMIDYLGELLGVVRLPAQDATATIRFTLSATQLFDVVIPAGTRVQTQDGAVIFETSEEATCAIGETFVDVDAAATAGGTIGNGYIAGQISVLLDAIATVESAANTTTSADGVEIEDDERLRQRIREAPERFSVAGPAGAYRFHAMSAHQSIIDVAVTSPAPGEVSLYVLTDTGLPSQPILDLVTAVVDGEKVRPLSDTVEVLEAVEVNYQIEAALTLYADADQAATMAAALAAAEAYAADRRAGLGRDIVLSQVVAALSAVPGVYSVELTEPAASAVVEAVEWANCDDIDLTFAGFANG